MTVLFQSPADLQGYLFRIVDNGGSSSDRYTVVFADDTYLAMSSYPTHPQGISIWGESLDPATLEEWVENGQAVDLALGDLPAELVQHILDRNNQGLQDLLESVEKRETGAVAANRDAAEINEGTFHRSTGVGIYVTEQGYFVRRDGSPEDDRGPFQTAREVLLASLPDEHGYCGPEYHSTVEIMRLTPDPEVKTKIIEIEKRRNAEWQASQRPTEILSI